MSCIFLRKLWKGDAGGPQLERGIAVERFPCVVGRDSTSDYLIHHPQISRRHCSFFLQDDKLWVIDLGSLNGTFVNGQRIEDAVALADGDHLKLACLPFEVYLGVPALQQDAAVAPESRHVLVVEDDRDTARAMARLLEVWGHKVHVAHDGPEALLAAQAIHPDTILMDIRLPGMDGYQVAERLRDQEGMANTRLVAITGHAAEKDSDRSREAGFDQLLVKPVNPETLHDVLEEAR